jgi:hypothetical protein
MMQNVACTSAQALSSFGRRMKTKLVSNDGPTAVCGAKAECGSHFYSMRRNCPMIASQRIGPIALGMLWRPISSHFTDASSREPSISFISPLPSASSHVPGYNSAATNHASGRQFVGTGVASLPEGSSYGPGLVKQTYSAYVTQPGTSIQRKFHLTAYFTYADLPNLPTLESEPRLWSIVIPQGVYRSGKSRTYGKNLANAAEPVRTHQQTGDSSPSPTSSPSSISHSPTSQWSSAKRGSGSYYESSTGDGPHSPGGYRRAGGGHSPYIGSPSHQSPLSPRIGPIPSNYTSNAKLPSVASLGLDTDGPRRNRNSEDDRVINMLNSRPIP